MSLLVRASACGFALTTVLRCVLVSQRDLAKHLSRFEVGTRSWLMDRIRGWTMEEARRALWLMGGAGLGKSVMAAQIIQHLNNAGILG